MTNFDINFVHRGEKKWGYVNIINSLSTKVDMPVMVINGEASGPTFTVTGGLYPLEYCGVEAAGRLYNEVNPKDLSGKLIIIPVVNMPVFQFRTPMFALTKSLSPFDGKDITKVFPGNLNGSVTEVLAYKLFNDFIKTSDFHVDLRGGELEESHLQHTIFLQTGKEIDSTLKEMGVVFGLRYCLSSRPDISHTTPGTLAYEAVNLGIPSIISESGLGFNTQPADWEIYGHVDGVKNLMRNFHMLDGEMKRPQAQNFLLPDRERVFAPVSGIFKHYADQGDILKNDQLIGAICDLDCRVLSELHSPCDAVVHEMMPRRIVYQGDRVYSLAVVGEPTGFQRDK